LGKREKLFFPEKTNRKNRKSANYSYWKRQLILSGKRTKFIPSTDDKIILKYPLLILIWTNIVCVVDPILMGECHPRQNIFSIQLAGITN